LPKLIEVTINFAPIHEETLGYATFGMDMEQPIGNFHRFPYGVELAKDAAGPALPPSVSDAVAKEREEAEKQRKAASAQQEEDKKKSKSTKLFNKANRKERRADRRQGRLDRRQGTLDETRGEIEDLRTEAMFQSAVEDGLFEGEPAGSVDAGRFMV
jgi:type IV secretory pathway VirB10-like protein